MGLLVFGLLCCELVPPLVVVVTPFVRGFVGSPGEEGGGTGSLRPPVNRSVAGSAFGGRSVCCGVRRGDDGEREASLWGSGRGEPGGVGAGALFGIVGPRRAAVGAGGIWGRERPGEAFGGVVPFDPLVGEVGFVSREGSVGLGEAVGEGRPLTGGFTGEMWPFLNGELDTIFNGERSEVSGEASGGTGGFCDLTGECRGGREGGASSWGEADLTVFTDAVEDNESDDEVTESLLGEIGDLLSPRSSLEDESLPLILLAIALTGGLELTLVVPLELSSSWELDLAMFAPN